MAIRLSGINSGMDTDSMIKKIMDAQRTTLRQGEGKKTKLEWKQDKWKELNTKLYSLYTNKISALRFSSAYTTKKVSSSDENIVKVTGDPSASDGAHKMQVKQVATAQSVTGAKVTDIEDFGKDSVLTDIGFELGEEVTFKVGDKEHTLEVNGDTTVGDFLNAAKKAGINATLDT